MENKQLQVEIEILRLFKPIAQSAGSSVDKIAEQLKIIHGNAEETNSDLWKIYNDKVYQHLKYISEIQRNYEEYKSVLIAQLLEDKSDLTLKDNKRVELDKNANVLFVLDANNNKELL